MRAKPRPPVSDPFKEHPRSKQWKAAESECIRKRNRDGNMTFDAILKWHYGERSPEEELFFGEGYPTAFKRWNETPHPFWSLIKKEPLSG